ncbi:MAG: acetyl-coenzyme A synthetase N-terminal domain-containing protein, partial [Allopontixanthobacter sediminis]
MSDTIHPVPDEWAKSALIDEAGYHEKYRQSVTDPDTFWRREAQRIDWIRPFETVKDTSFDEQDFRIRWFEGGTLNLAANCLDRHLETRGDQIAIIWEPDNPSSP